MVPAADLLPFIVDATLTLAKRAARGEPFWQAHREHYYQRLVRMGLGHRRTALAEYVLMAAAGICAWSLLRAPAFAQQLTLAVWAAIYLALAVLVNKKWALHMARKRYDRLNPRSAAALAHDIVAAAVAWYLAYWLRFNTEIPQYIIPNMVGAMLWVVPLQTAIFFGSGMYRGIWRYASVPTCSASPWPWACRPC